MTRALATPRALLVLAAIAVGFAAADTYVVVLALPDMIASVGLSIDQLQRGAPVVSGFLLGYVAMLPLVGRIADIRGRIPVLVGSLVAFSVGSLVTAASYDLVTMVAGRFIQGAGGGGLVPATLALVADIWPAERRGLPLGVVGAVQELGAVIGPLYGALILTRWTWRTIFWVNLAASLVIVAALLTVGARPTAESAVASPAKSRRPTLDFPGIALALLALAALVLVMTEPQRLASGLTTGLAFIRYAGDSRWSTPMSLAFVVLLALFVVRQATARRPLVGWRGWRGLARSADLPGAALLAVVLAGIVLAFATADPQVEVLSSAGPWLLTVSAAAAVAFVLRQRSAATPLVPPGALRARRAWGALVVSFFVGSALIAALVDVPIFARVTVYPHSQLDAALVLVRLLVAIPVGAVLGGYLCRRVRATVLASAGMALAGLGFVTMTTWGLTTLNHADATLPLVVCGLGFGISIAPTNAALLAASVDAVHGLASAFLVVARMVGMLVGVSALTTIGLRRFYQVSAAQPTLHQVCHANAICPAYVNALKEAGIAQLHVVFWGAAVCAGAAAVLSAVLLRPAEPQASIASMSSS
ncbi:MAG: hypothetical protein QOI51_1388 [Nocardioidaceae bacterium]|nr:hypothetical protein [Nocardioidaceae bacterium]